MVKSWLYQILPKSKADVCSIGYILVVCHLSLSFCHQHTGSLLLLLLGLSPPNLPAVGPSSWAQKSSWAVMRPLPVPPWPPNVITLPKIIPCAPSQQQTQKKKKPNQLAFIFIFQVHFIIIFFQLSHRNKTKYKKTHIVYTITLEDQKETCTTFFRMIFWD